MIANPYTQLLVAITIGVIGQLLLKHGMSRHPAFQLRDLASLATNFSVLGGFCCYGVATLLYFKVLGRLDLSIAYPTVSLGYVLVIVLSRILFKERIGRARVLAALIICSGVALVGLTS
jgi:drug/metabolite transporter (DMT)-like permease